jgi:hypothetical protein
MPTASSAEFCDGCGFARSRRRNIGTASQDGVRGALAFRYVLSSGVRFVPPSSTHLASWPRIVILHGEVAYSSWTLNQKRL